jgi:hypothetical protein
MTIFGITFTMSDLISLCAFGVSLGAFFNSKNNRKEDFLEKFRSDLWEVELDIIRLQPNRDSQGLTQEDFALLETIRHKLRYQCCAKQKKKYLSWSSRMQLDKLQEEIEDCFGNIKANINPDIHRNQAINAIKNFLNTI